MSHQEKQPNTSEWINKSTNSKIASQIQNSAHAALRESQRGITSKQLTLAYRYGRIAESRRANFYVIGKKEILQHAKKEPALIEMEGLQLIVSNDGVILTAYKNKDLRKIRPYKKRKDIYIKIYSSGEFLAAIN